MSLYFKNVLKIGIFQGYIINEAFLLPLKLNQKILQTNF